MPRTARACPGSGDPRAGLRALAALVNETLAGLGRPPALVFCAAAAGPLPSQVRRVAVDTTRSRHTSARPGTGRAGQASPPPPADGPQDAEASGTRDPVEAEHTEMWRLVTLAQSGDGDAFGQLYDRYVDTVYRFVYFRVNDRTLAEDFTSETFLRALRRIGTISYQGRDIGAWFVTIARNIILDHVKSARNRLEITTADTLERDDRAPSPESEVIDALTSDRLMAAVRQLGEEQRECVMLRFIQGFSVSETAAVMGKNDGAVKALQHRAVRKLADLVGGDLR
jgi:RNA polymerase sigma-70 factor (ECF subfamily)